MKEVQKIKIHSRDRGFVLLLLLFLRSPFALLIMWFFPTATHTQIHIYIDICMRVFPLHSYNYYLEFKLSVSQNIFCLNAFYVYQFIIHALPSINIYTYMHIVCFVLCHNSRINWDFQLQKYSSAKLEYAFRADEQRQNTIWRSHSIRAR